MLTRLKDLRLDWFWWSRPRSNPVRPVSRFIAHDLQYTGKDEKRAFIFSVDRVGRVNRLASAIRKAAKKCEAFRILSLTEG